MKMPQELVDRVSSVNPSKRKFTNNYTSCSMLLHYVRGFTDPQTAVDVHCACVADMIYSMIHNLSEWATNTGH